MPKSYYIDEPDVEVGWDKLAKIGGFLLRFYCIFCFVLEVSIFFSSFRSASQFFIGILMLIIMKNHCTKFAMKEITIIAIVKRFDLI